LIIDHPEVKVFNDKQPDHGRQQGVLDVKIHELDSLEELILFFELPELQLKVDLNISDQVLV
jgi:hypothetical protein